MAVGGVGEIVNQAPTALELKCLGAGLFKEGG